MRQNVLVYWALKRRCSTWSATEFVWYAVALNNKWTPEWWRSDRMNRNEAHAAKWVQRQDKDNDAYILTVVRITRTRKAVGS